MITCKDCIHYDVCIRIRYPSMYGLTGESCEHFAQKSWFDPAQILIPCRIGQDMWCIRNFNGAQHPTKGEVSEMYFTAQMKLMIVVKYVGRGEYGKTVFPTKEEAEAEIERRKHEHH